MRGLAKGTGLPGTGLPEDLCLELEFKHTGARNLNLFLEDINIGSPGTGLPADLYLKFKFIPKCHKYDVATWC